MNVTTSARHSTPFAKSLRRAHEFVKRGAWREAEAAFAAIEGDRRFGLRDCLALAASRLRVDHFEAAGRLPREKTEQGDHGEDRYDETGHRAVLTARVHWRPPNVSRCAHSLGFSSRSTQRPPSTCTNCCSLARDPRTTETVAV